MTIDPTGPTNENTLCTTTFSLSNLAAGQKLAAQNWLDSITIGGVNVAVAGCLLNQGNAGTSGSIGAPIKVMAGSYTVTIKVKLNDNTIVTKTATVEYQKMLGPPTGD